MNLKAVSLLALVFALHALWVVASRRRPSGAILRTKRRLLLHARHAGCPIQAVRWMPL